MIFGRGTPVQKEWEAFIKREKMALGRYGCQRESFWEKRLSGLVPQGDSAKLDAAWKLVEYIGCPEGQEILAATGFQFPIYQSVAFDEDYLAVYENSKPSNYEIFLKSASTQPAGTWMYLTSDQWKELGYDGLSAPLLDTNANDRWTVERFLDECKTTIDQLV